MSETSSPARTFTLTDDQRKWLVRRAFQSAPQEACGFILECGTIVEINNISPNPHRSFSMSAVDVSKKLVEQDVSRIVAIWHSHPSGSLIPSEMDKNAYLQGAIRRSWAYIIATKDDVAVYDPRETLGG